MNEAIYIICNPKMPINSWNSIFKNRENVTTPSLQNAHKKLKIKKAKTKAIFFRF
jgi:hypothetical protein